MNNSNKVFIQMPEGALFIINALARASREAYAVGGCVRDGLLGKTPVDWDIATNANPEKITSVFKKVGCLVVPTGVKHGTVTVVYKKTHYEVTTYRVDGDYTDGRRPESVVFTDDLTGDLSRRDFTINAMAYNDEAGLIDPFGGRGDLARRLVRCVGSAEKRMAEDYLRMLRAYRIAATLDFTIDGEIIRTVSENKHKLKEISAERIRVEFEKTLLNGCPGGIDSFLDAFLSVIISDQRVADASGELKKILRAAGRDIIIMLAAVLLPVETDKAEAELRSLKYDNDTIKRAAEVHRFAKTKIKADKPSVKRVMSRTGAELFSKINSLQKAVCAARGGDLDEYAEKDKLLDEILENNEPYSLRSLAITGDDIMRELSAKPGEWVGIELNRLLGAVMRDPSLNDKNALLEIVKESPVHET